MVVPLKRTETGAVSGGVASLLLSVEDEVSELDDEVSDDSSSSTATSSPSAAGGRPFRSAVPSKTRREPMCPSLSGATRGRPPPLAGAMGDAVSNRLRASLSKGVP